MSKCFEISVQCASKFSAGGKSLATRTAEGGDMPESERRMPWFAFLVYLFAAGLILYASIANRPTPPKQLPYSEFVTQVLNGKVDAVRVTSTELIGVAKASGETTAKDTITTSRLPSMDESWLMQELRQHDVQIIADPQSDKWWPGLL